MIPATAILITKDREYPQEVWRSLPVFEKVIVETECKHIYRRYMLAMKEARGNTLFYIQDDDCVIDVKFLYSKYNGRPTNAISQHHLNFYKDVGCSLVGFGTFLDKKTIDFSEYLTKYEMDSLFLSQADRVYTYLNRPLNSIVMPIKHMPWATAPDRMSSEPNHWENLRQILERLHSLK